MTMQLVVMSCKNIFSLFLVYRKNACGGTENVSHLVRRVAKTS